MARQQNKQSEQSKLDAAGPWHIRILKNGIERAMGAAGKSAAAQPAVLSFIAFIAGIVDKALGEGATIRIMSSEAFKIAAAGFTQLPRELGVLLAAMLGLPPELGNELNQEGWDKLVFGFFDDLPAQFAGKNADQQNRLVNEKADQFAGMLAGWVREKNMDVLKPVWVKKHPDGRAFMHMPSCSALSADAREVGVEVIKKASVQAGRADRTDRGGDDRPRAESPLTIFEAERLHRAVWTTECPCVGFRVDVPGSFYQARERLSNPERKTVDDLIVELGAHGTEILKKGDEIKTLTAAQLRYVIEIASKDKAKARARLLQIFKIEEKKKPDLASLAVSLKDKALEVVTSPDKQRGFVGDATSAATASRNAAGRLRRF
ncbi:hypothetical protein IT407_04390 [Candidatus Uhrbacteria bacterium]|nr:hypothetical protein [Candidatus Uhrbacteria bacterium]